MRDLLKPYEKSIEAQKLCFIIGVGWMPGISGVFSKTIIETHLNSPENTNFNIYYGAVDNWSYSSTYDLAASCSPARDNARARAAPRRRRP